MEDFTPATLRKAKKMLMVLAESCPQHPNMSELYRELETNRNLGLKMLEALERAELVMSIDSGNAKLKHLSKPEKLFLGDTNLMNALAPRTNPGAVRETFFASQLLAASHKVVAPRSGDFCVNDKYLFEVGGPGKGFEQIKGIPNSYVAQDGVETGIGNKIPLWLFGFLY
jgi:predicted AAA+ superfamily ATPase